LWLNPVQLKSAQSIIYALPAVAAVAWVDSTPVELAAVAEVPGDSELAHHSALVHRSR
jgi:hypothetical protein